MPSTIRNKEKLNQASVDSCISGSGGLGEGGTDMDSSP